MSFISPSINIWIALTIEHFGLVYVLYVHIILLFYDIDINAYTQFTLKVRIIHIWKTDACVLWYTHIKTLAYAAWLSKQTLFSKGGSEFWEINEPTTSQLLTLMLWEMSSGATEQQQTRNTVQQMKRTKQKSKKHLNLKIFWPQGYLV